MNETSASVRSVLAQKEREGFYILCIVRLLLIAAVCIAHIFTYHAIKELYFVCGIGGTLAAATVALLVFARHNNINDAAFGAGLFCDVAILACLPVLWYYAAGGTVLPAAYLTKTMLPFMWLLVLFLYIIPLKPLLPLVAGFCAALIHGAILLYASADPRTLFSVSLLGISSVDTVVVSYQVVAMLCAVFGGTIGAYISNTVRLLVLQNARATEDSWFGNANLPEGVNQTGAVLHAEIRDFAELAAKLEAESVFKMLSLFHQTMRDVIAPFSGVIAEPSGGWVSAFFAEGGAQGSSGGADCAIKAAVLMGKACEELNAKLSEQRIPAVTMDIGVHYGKAVCGLIVSQQGSALSIAGFAPNVAERVASACKTTEHTLLLTGETRERLLAKSRVKPVGFCKLRGQEERLELYTADGDFAV